MDLKHKISTKLILIIFLEKNIHIYRVDDGLDIPVNRKDISNQGLHKFKMKTTNLKLFIMKKSFYIKTEILNF